MDKSFLKYGIYTGMILSVIIGVTFYKMFLSTPDIDISKMKIVDLNGASIDKIKLASKPLVINYWATWCAPCVAELPEFETMSKKYKNQVNFVFISDEKIDVIKKFCDRKKYDLVFLKSVDDLSLLGLSVRPATYFYKTDGALDESVVGGMKLEEIEKHIETIISKNLILFFKSYNTTF